MSGKVIYLPVDASLKGQTRVLRSLLLRSTRFRVGVLISLLAFVSITIFQDAGFISFHPSFFDMVVYNLVLIAVLAPYIVMFSLWAKSDNQTETLKTLISADSFEIRGHSFQCEVPWSYVIGVKKMKEHIVFSMKFPFSGIFFRITDLGENEPDLYSILVEKKIRCVGKWQKPTKASPPPLPPGKSDD